MSRMVRSAAVVLLVVWVSMMAAPVVFGAPVCECHDCRQGRCDMKQHQDHGSEHSSCHGQTTGAWLKSRPCHHEAPLFALDYQAVLPGVDYNLSFVSSFSADSLSPNLSAGCLQLEAPPPKSLQS